MSNLSMGIANAFLRKPGALGNLTQMKLLKLTYIAHGWNLAVNGAPLILEDVLAWDYGPVILDLYDHVKFYGTEPITRPITDMDNQIFKFFRSKKPEEADVYEAALLDSEKDVIERVWRRYGQYSAFKLSDLTHKPGTPWYETYFGDGEGKNAVIPNGRIRAHYVELARASGG
jgi:uncharacterized phage-associated protein